MTLAVQEPPEPKKPPMVRLSFAGFHVHFWADDELHYDAELKMLWVHRGGLGRRGILMPESWSDEQRKGCFLEASRMLAWIQFHTVQREAKKWN